MDINRAIELVHGEIDKHIMMTYASAEPRLKRDHLELAEALSLVAGEATAAIRSRS